MCWCPCSKEKRFLTLRQRAELALGAANGMAYLHQMEVVHFDLKPDNLLVDGDLSPGGTPVVKVADFGLSKHKWDSYVSGVTELRWVSKACQQKMGGQGFL